MDEIAFRESVRSGLGRALHHARARDVSDFREIILDACLHCYSVDPAAEGTRALYISQLIDLTTEPEFYKHKILQALPGHGDDWHAVLRFRLASHMAMEGDVSARRAMYENFHPGPSMAESMAADFVEMDGMAGFLFAAEKIGALLLVQPDEVDEGFLLGHATEVLGEETVISALQEAGRRNAAVEAYRRTAEANRALRRGDDEGRFNRLAYTEFKVMQPGKRPYPWSSWATHASAEDLERAAQGLLAAQHPDELLAHLQIFAVRPFPLNQAHLLRLAESANPRLAAAAARALANLTHSSIREYAFALVEKRRANRDKAIAILARNWQEGDHHIVLGWFLNEECREIRHSHGIHLKNAWKWHPNASTEVDMLVALYERGPCSVCREFAVSRLLRLGALPDSLREECADDCNEDTRRLVDGSKDGSEPAALGPPGAASHL